MEKRKKSNRNDNNKQWLYDKIKKMHYKLNMVYNRVY